MHIQIFIETLTEHIEDNNLSVLQFSKRVGVNSSTVTRWLSYEFLPNISDIIKVSTYLDLSIDYLFGLNDMPEKCTSCTGIAFSNKLLTLLNKNKVTSYKLAKDCNFQSSAVSKWLNSLREPRIINCIEIAKYFNCTLDYLLN